MPYTLSSPPDRIKKLPKHAQAIFIAAYNNAHKRRPDDEAYCNKVAWAAVNEKYEKDAEGNWKRKKKATEEVDISFEHTRDLVNAAVLEKYGETPSRHMWVTDTYVDHVIASDDTNKYWSIPYSIDADGNVTLGEPTEVERTYVEVEEHVVLEGWLPQGVSQNDLDDGDFAWLSDAYSKASAKEREGMNKRESRKLPYKVHGKVNREGWKAAWRAVAWRTYLRPDLSGGPSQEQVMTKLRRDKPSGIILLKDNTYTDTHEAKEERLQQETLAVIPGALGELEVLLEEGGSAVRSDGVLRVRGTALIDEAISSNNRYYSPSFNDRAMEHTNTWMTEGGVVTVFSRHGKAVGPLPTGLPVGKVADPLFRAGNKIKFIAEVHPTEEGKDVQVLLRGQVFFKTSIRTRDFRSTFQQIDGRVVEVMEDAIIQGIDFTDDPGVDGAGVEAILEEAPTLAPLLNRKEEDVEYNELTLAALQQNRPDLLQEHAASVLEANKEAVVEERVTALQGQLATLTEEHTQLTAKVAGLELDLVIEQASQIGVGKAVAAELRSKKVKSADEIAQVIGPVREAALSQFLAKASTETGKGKGQTGEPALEEHAPVTVTPEVADIVRLAGGHIE